jgi:hypothetical protein
LASSAAVGKTSAAAFFASAAINCAAETLASSKLMGSNIFIINPYSKRANMKSALR